LNILFVLNQLPYPPRNGVTIPSYNLLTGLSRAHNIDLLFLDTGKEVNDCGMLDNNKNIVDRLWVSSVRANESILSRIYNELIGKAIFHISGEYDFNELQIIISSKSYDAVWISGESILNVAAPLHKMMPSNVIFIAGLNDSISAPFRQARKFIFLGEIKLKDRLLNLIKWLRSGRVAYIEKNILGAFDLILLQTEEDRRCVNIISSNLYDDRILVVPNGVNQDLFNVVQDRQVEGKVILFIGILSGNYSKIAVWLIERVWPLIKSKIPDAKFSIIGKGASEQLLSKISSDDDIEYIAYVPDIVDVYKGKSVAVLPVFKGFGLINKVIESMAAGIPVVGDRSSFNGINGYIDGTHGLISEGEVEMANNVIKLLLDSELSMEIAARARQLVQQQFGWSDSVEIVNNAIESLYVIR
jgi:glycosyltransferase involved in cell wall biosynthesis